MKINIIAVHHKLQDWIELGIINFIKRFSWQIKLIDLKPSNKQSSNERKILEYNDIKKNIPKACFIIVLDELGKSITTNDLVNNINAWQLSYSNFCFIIGGADGIYADLKKEANYVMRLSDMTLPHGFAKLFLIEQLYRSWSIMNNHPYHRI